MQTAASGWWRTTCSVAGADAGWSGVRRPPGRAPIRRNAPHSAATAPLRAPNLSASVTHGRADDRGLIAQPRRLLAGALLLLLLHACLRLAFTHAIEVDHAEQLVLAQRLQIFYGARQPPLYTWIMWLLEQPFGPSRALAIGLKYLLFLAAGCAGWMAARNLGATRREAGLYIASLFLLYQIFWKMHHGVSHTALLCFASAATLYALARLRQHDRPRDHLLLAAAIVLGVLSKHVYWAFLGALLAAALADPLWRQRLCAPRSVWLWLPVLAVAAPYLVGLIRLPGTLAAELAATVTPAADARHPLWAYGVGLQGLGLAVLGYLSFLLLPMLVAPWLRADPPPAADDPQRIAGVRLLLRLNLWLLTLLLAMVLVGGATRFVERWMHAFLLWLPMAWVLAQGRLGRLAPGRPLPAIVLGLAGLLLAVSFGWQATQFLYGPPACGKCRVLIDYTPLAQALAQDGLADADVLATDEHIAANLRLALPGLAVRVAAYPQIELPRRAGRPCALVWNLQAGESPPASLLELARAWCGEGGASAAQAITLPLARLRLRHPGWRRTLPAPHQDAAYGFAFARFAPAPAIPPPALRSGNVSVEPPSEQSAEVAVRRDRRHQAGAESSTRASRMSTMPRASARVGTSPNWSQPASSAMTGFASEASEASLAERRSMMKVHSNQPSALPPMAVKAKAQRNSGVQSGAGPWSMNATSTSSGVP